MSGGKYLVSLQKVTNLEKNVKISSIKENVNFWQEDIFINNDLKETVLKIEKKISPIMTGIFETEYNENSKQVAVYIAGYVAKKINIFTNKCHVIVTMRLSQMITMLKMANI